MRKKHIDLGMQATTNLSLNFQEELTLRNHEETKNIANFRLELW